MIKLLIMNKQGARLDPSKPLTPGLALNAVVYLLVPHGLVHPLAVGANIAANGNHIGHALAPAIRLFRGF
jgi:hypothetical protein